jgi:hypothetical protein
VVLLFGSSEPEARRVLVPPENPKCLGHFPFGGRTGRYPGRYAGGGAPPDGPAKAKNERSFSLVSRSRDDSVRTNAQSTA